MDRMRPMSEAPRDGTAVLLWWKEATYDPDVARYHTGNSMWLTDSDGAYQDAVLAGWTPIVRPLEPDAPEPEAQTVPPTPQRLRLQIQSAAQESVALRQPLAAFQALAGVAHLRATQRAARVGR